MTASGTKLHAEGAVQPWMIQRSSKHQLSLYSELVAVPAMCATSPSPQTPDWDSVGPTE